VEIPLGMMVVVSGVSGSGKSTLVHDVIHRSLQALLKEDSPEASPDESDSPDTGAPRHLFARRRRQTSQRSDHDRPVAHRPHTAFESGHLHSGVRPDPGLVRGYAGRSQARLLSRTFLFQRARGRCEVCQGEGTVKVEMQFLADVELICEECKGTRYKAGILEIRRQG
jgi:excinuclease ABC subunit A